MNMRIVTGAAVAAAAAALIVGSMFGQQSLIAQTRKGLPMFEVDPKFPQLAEGMVLGESVALRRIATATCGLCSVHTRFLNTTPR